MAILLKILAYLYEESIHINTKNLWQPYNIRGKVANYMNSLFSNYELPKQNNIKSERALVISDILELANRTHGIKKKLTARNVAVFLSPFKTPDLYPLLSKMKNSKSPASLFWWYVKNK